MTIFIHKLKKKLVHSYLNFKAQTRIIQALSLFLLASSLCFGLYYDYTVYIAGIVLLVMLIVIIKKKHSIIISPSIAFGCIVIVVLFYWGVIPWSVDRGMALIGALKKSVPVIFLLVMIQLNEENKLEILKVVPVSGLFMLFVSSIAYFIPAIRDYFVDDNRLGGGFQYSNTFALFLLLGLIFVFNTYKDNKTKGIVAVLLSMGILATGSRFIFVLALLWFFWFCIVNKAIRKKALFGLLILLGVAVIVAIGTQQFNNIGRFLTIGLTESTFLGRLLYYKDGISLLLEKPWGLGYLGFNYIQAAIQTGPYVIRFIHNDWLQVALDIGILPLILMGLGFFLGIKKSTILQKQLFFILLVAGCFDFNMEFTFMAFMLMITFTFTNKKAYSTSRWGYGIIGCAIASYGYFALALGLGALENPTTAITLFPYNTEAKVKLLVLTEDKNTTEQMVDSIIKGNEHIALAYEGKAVLSLANQDYPNMMRYMQLSIANNRYSITAYETYLKMLDRAITNANHQGDSEMVQDLAMQIQRIPMQLEQVKASTDPMAWQFREPPKLDLSQQYIDYINALIKALE